MSQNRVRELLGLMDKIIAWATVPVLLLLVGGYLVIDYFWTSDQSSLWRGLPELLKDVIANLIPVCVLFIGSYLLFRRIPSMKAEQEMDELVSRVCSKVAHILEKDSQVETGDLDLLPASTSSLPGREGPVCRKFVLEPLTIRSDLKNRQVLSSVFLGWERCTIMFWVLVPPKGKDLRNAPHNRYLLAHQFGGDDYNRFSLRYTGDGDWRVDISGSQGELQQIVVDDGLSSGWHHFMLAWDRGKPELTFLIDGGNSGNGRLESYLSNWPERLDDSVYIGAWVGRLVYDESYCDTKLFELWVYDRFLDASDRSVQEHLALEKQLPPG